MKRVRFFLFLAALLVALASCMLPGAGKDRNEFKPRIDFDEVKQGAFQLGEIAKEYLRGDTFVKFKTTSKLYGYFYILHLDPLAGDWVVFDKDGKVLKHEEGIELGAARDFDNDGVKDVVCQGTALIFNSSEDHPSLFSYEFPNGIFSFTPEGGRIFKTDPERFQPIEYNGILPSATLVYYSAGTFPKDVKEGDVIFDVRSYPYMGEMVIRKVVSIKRNEDIVVVESTPVSLEDVVPVLELNFKGGMENAIPLNTDAQLFMQVSRSGDHLLSYDGSRTLYSGKYATLTAYYGFSMDADFDVSLDYDWNSFDAQVTASLQVSHDLTLRLKAGADYKKSDHTDPFFEPSFTFSVYGIPVVVSFPIYVGYDFEATGTADATVGYRLSASANVGETISGELTWSGIDVSHNHSLGSSGSADLIGPEFEMRGKASVRTYVGVDVKVSLAKMAYAQFINHPYIKPIANAYFQGDPYPDGRIDFDAKYGIDFSLKAGYDFKAKKDDWEKHLKDWEFGGFGSWRFGFPAPPTNLYAEFRAGQGVELSWTDNSSYETGFLIKRERWNGSTWINEGEFTVNEDVTSYTDSSAAQNVRYNYTVRAYSDWPTGDRYKSQAMSYRVDGGPPPKPRDPYVSPYSDAASLKPRLSWKCEADDISSFDLYLGTTNPPPLFEESISVDTGAVYSFSYALNEELNGDTTYYWKIVVHDDEGFTTEGDVWSFTTVADGKGYVYVRGYNKSPFGPNFNAPAVTIEGIRVNVDSNEYTTSATVLVDTGARLVTAQYDPNTETGEDTQWLFEEWVSPETEDPSNPEIWVNVSDDVNAWFVAAKFHRVNIITAGGGTVTVTVSQDSEEGRESFYKEGSVITLSADPNGDNVFQGWYVNGVSEGSDSNLTITVDQPLEIEARFSGP